MLSYKINTLRCVRNVMYSIRCSILLNEEIAFLCVTLPHTPSHFLLNMFVYFDTTCIYFCNNHTHYVGMQSSLFDTYIRGTFIQLTKENKTKTLLVHWNPYMFPSNKHHMDTWIFISYLDIIIYTTYHIISIEYTLNKNCNDARKKKSFYLCKI